MKNITLSIEEPLLKAGREYAQSQHTTLNALIRTLLSQTVQNQNTEWLTSYFKKANKLNIGSKKTKPWKREDLYDV
jgi:hypothetical protein